ARLHDLAPFLAHIAGSRGTPQQLEDSRCGDFGGIDGDEKPAPSVCQGFRVAACCSGYTGEAAGHRLEERIRQAIASGEMTEHVTDLEEREDIVEWPREAHIALKTEPCDQRLELGHVVQFVVVANEDEDRVGKLAAYPSSGAHECVGALDAADPAGIDDQVRRILQAEPGPKIGLDLGRRDSLQVDAVVEGHDLPPVPPVVPDGELTNSVGDCLHLIEHGSKQAVCDIMLERPLDTHVATAGDEHRTAAQPGDQSTPEVGGFEEGMHNADLASADEPVQEHGSAE